MPGRKLLLEGHFCRNVPQNRGQIFEEYRIHTKYDEFRISSKYSYFRQVRGFISVVWLIQYFHNVAGRYS